MVRKKVTNGYLILTGLYIAAVCISLFLFLIDVAIFDFKTPFLFVIYGYMALPILGIVYGIISYRLLEKVILPDLLYILLSVILVFVMYFAMAYVEWALEYGDVGSALMSKAMKALPLMGLTTLFTIIPSIILCVISSVIAMIIKKLGKSTAETDRSTTETEQVTNDSQE